MALNPTPHGTPEQPASTPAVTESTAAKKPKKEKKVKPPKVKKPGRGRKILGITSAAVLGLFSFIGMQAYLGAQTPATETVYALKEPMPANAVAVASLFEETTAPVGSVPGEVLTAEDLDGNTWYAEEDLQPGDLATDANFNRNTRISIDSLNDSSLMAQTFTASPDNAVGGRLRAGDYVSILRVIDGNEAGSTAEFVLDKVLLLDVSGEPQDVQSGAASTGIGGSAGGDTDEGRYQGVPVLYTVALNAEQTRLLTAAKDSNLTVVLTRVDAPGVGGKTPTAKQAPADDVAVEETVVVEETPVTPDSGIATADSADTSVASDSALDTPIN